MTVLNERDACRAEKAGRRVFGWRSLMVAMLAGSLFLGSALTGDDGASLAEEDGGAGKSPVTEAKASSAAERDKTLARDYNEHVRPFLAKHCLACHGIDKPKGDLRLDKLTPDFADRAGRQLWQRVVERVQAGEMPPKGSPKPDEKAKRALAGWVQAKTEAVESEGRVVLRRLNRVEYENSVRDLLGVEVDLRDLLPLDGSLHGFDNVGEALHVSSFLMDKYLEAADVALDAAIANAPQPPLIKKRYDLRDERHVKVTKENVFRKLENALVFFTSSAWHNVVFSQFYPKDRGRYRFRISTYAVQSGGKPVAYRITAGPMLMGQKNHLVGYFDAPADEPRVLEFVERLEARNTISIIPYGLLAAQGVNKIGADKYEGPGLAVEWIDVEGPLHEVWPPESHRRIFGDLPQAPARDDKRRLEVVSKDAEADAARILHTFAGRAFRRTLSEDDVKPYLKLVKARLAKGHTFEQAIRVGLKAVMVSPQFLFLVERPGKLDDFALAGRLAYFLWSTMPDEELLKLAEEGKLSQPATLKAQVERLLKSPKAAAFTQNFVGQWLGLREIDATQPDFRLYPEFDELLKVSMVKETHLFFDELLKNDLSLTNFVASDFTLLNGRLAKHYGLPDIEGHDFRKVKLPADSHRGGVLTMASVLKVTANGTNTSPVARGAWVLDRILGRPPSPPPDGVPAVEPDIRGATTIREQLAKHRTVPSCASCHTRIDPPGFALESFDVIGGWRENYRTLGKGAPVMIDGKRMMYLKGPKVDPGDVLPDGRTFRDIDEFKKLLLEEREQIARALAERLITYATGAAPRAADRPHLDAIVTRLRDQGYGLRTLVHEIVQSEPFRHK